MKSEELFRESQKFLVGGVNSPVRAFRGVGGEPFFTARAEGSKLHTCDGKELIDMVCSWGPAILGHNNSVIRHALEAAITKGTSFGTPSEGELEMARMINKMIPCAEMVRMTNSGTEATMSAIRLARGFTGRDRIVKFSGCYHGHVDSLLVKAGSGALTLGNPDSAGVPRALAELTSVLPFNDIDAVSELFSKLGGEIACVILEPYPANVGLILPDENFLRALREICTDYGALLIFDEVITGFRLAKGGAQAREGVIPDLCALGKIIGGGLPVGAFCGRREIMEHLAPIGKVYQAGTLSGNPLAMAAGTAALSEISKRNPYSELNENAQKIKSALENAAKTKGLAISVPQAGSLFSIFFNDGSAVKNFDDAMKSSRELYSKFFRHCLDNGVYFAPSPFEVAFLSCAHSSSDIVKISEVASKSIQVL